MNLSPAREKKPSRGRWLTGLGQGSAAARPLDGGVLTRWGAHVPAKGPAMAPRLAMAARSAFLTRGCSVAAVFAAVEKRERAKREKREEPNELGFSGPPRGVGFDPAEDGARPSDQNQRPRMLGPSPAQAGASVRGTLPAQAQVAA